ncbi:MAG: type II toxin-antitoxin system mRNA interferase toxin, RelE/StbE family [Spirochaetaceae bacterium]|nr:type II toxin-antitoxin system mRNA interferase toxin, RelE/StbE family [Spirochaetaceae bacterium]
MRYKLATTKKFDKEYARLSESDRKTVDSVVNMILEGIHLPEKYHDHQLKGNLKNFRDCHTSCVCRFSPIANSAFKFCAELVTERSRSDHNWAKASKEYTKKQEPALGVFHSAKRLHPFGVAECFASQNPPTPALGFVQLRF